ncbi:hypothetical protein AYK26_00700 [Euryarchaeota archaeon SM23-78]|nr:MAG: hypothetical protein AYK26_00700 [Euryarchaeota archaeon SM23-78]
MKFFKVNATPSRAVKIIVPWVLFVLFFMLYVRTADVRHKANPKEKLTPKISQMIDGFKRSVFDPETRDPDMVKEAEDKFRLAFDTYASLRRCFIALAIIFLGVVIGLNMGTLPYLELLLYRFVLFFDKTPALAILPILFIVFGLGEVSKIALIVIGVMPTIILDTYLRAKAFPRELITKAMTLGASHGEIVYRIVKPNIYPLVLDTIRLNFKAVFLFLIAGESLAATVGLGYRIFVIRRYVAMDIIIPYVLWISLIAFTADLIVRVWINKRYRNRWLHNR